MVALFIKNHLKLRFLCFIKIAKTIPGRPAPDPRSVHVFISILSIKSMVCALSTICLEFIDFFCARTY